MLTVFDDWNQEPITAFQYIYGAVFLLQFMHAMTYVFWSYRYTQKAEHIVKEHYANFDLISIRWNQTFQLITVMVLLFLVETVGEFEQLLE